MMVKHKYDTANVHEWVMNVVDLCHERDLSERHLGVNRQRVAQGALLAWAELLGVLKAREFPDGLP